MPMEYRDFSYTNQLGSVELERGSIVGAVLSWTILRALHLGLLTAIGGVVFCSWTYFSGGALHAEGMSEASPVAVAASSVPAYDYHQHPLPVHPPVMLPVPSIYKPKPHTPVRMYQRS